MDTRPGSPRVAVREGMWSSVINDDASFYISGPMTGIEDFNFPAFERAAILLRGMGYEAHSPHEVIHDEPAGTGSLPWESYLRKDMILLLEKCDHILLLAGWHRSRGAKLEVHVANELGMPAYILYEEEVIQIDGKYIAKKNRPV